jgi:hypothetical protein
LELAGERVGYNFLQRRWWGQSTNRKFEYI